MDESRESGEIPSRCKSSEDRLDNCPRQLKASSGASASPKKKLHCRDGIHSPASGSPACTQLAFELLDSLGRMFALFHRCEGSLKRA
jgi:hypothetical protein